MFLLPQKSLLIRDNGLVYRFHLAIKYVVEDFKDLIKTQKSIHVFQYC